MDNCISYVECPDCFLLKVISLIVPYESEKYVFKQDLLDSLSIYQNEFNVKCADVSDIDESLEKLISLGAIRTAKLFAHEDKTLIKLGVFGKLLVDDCKLQI